MKIKIKLLLNLNNILISPNIGAILGQKGININLFKNIVSVYLTNVNCILLCTCFIFLFKKKILFIVIKKPTVFSLIKYYLNLSILKNVDYSLLKNKINIIITNIFIIKKKDLNTNNINLFKKIFIGNIKSYGFINCNV